MFTRTGKVSSPVRAPHSEGEIVRNAIRPALDAARAVGFPIVYVSNSAPRIALQQSAYGEQKWETLHVVKDEIYAERNVDPLEYTLVPPMSSSIPR